MNKVSTLHFHHENRIICGVISFKLFFLKRPLIKFKFKVLYF